MDRDGLVKERHSPDSLGVADREEHPKGALALTLLFGVLAIVVWLTVYFGIFVARG